MSPLIPMCVIQESNVRELESEEEELKSLVKQRLDSQLTTAAQRKEARLLEESMVSGGFSMALDVIVYSYFMCDLGMVDSRWTRQCFEQFAERQLSDYSQITYEITI